MRELPASIPGSQMDPQWSPDGRFASFIRSSTLFLSNIQTGEEIRLSGMLLFVIHV